jgi:hypothetical protein
VVLDAIGGQADNLDVPLFELGLKFRHVAGLGGTDGCKIFGVREYDRPAVADPVVELDRSLGGLSFEIGSDIA